MSTQHHHGPSPANHTPTNTEQPAWAHPAPRRSNAYGIVSLCFAAASFITAPLLLLVPVAGFIPALLAAAGIVAAWLGLRRDEPTPALAVTGLIVSVLLFGLTLSIATLWTQLVVGPAISDYTGLHEAIDHARQLIFGP